MTGEHVTEYWFVDRAPDGTVLHLVRVTETATAQFGEYLQDGTWHNDPSMLRYLTDRGMAELIEPDEGRALAAQLGADTTARSPGIAAGFAEYFRAFGLGLPDPIPTVGLVRHEAWTVRFRLADDGQRLDFLALSPHTLPIHGEVRADGSVLLHDSYRETYSVPADATPEDVARAEADLEAHNARVNDELARKGLI